MQTRINQSMVDTKFIAQRLGVSPGTVWRWWYENRLPGGFKSGKILRFDREQIERWIIEKIRSA